MSDHEGSSLEEFYSEDESIQGLNLSGDSDNSDGDDFIGSIKKVADIQKQQRADDEHESKEKSEKDAAHDVKESVEHVHVEDEKVHSENEEKEHEKALEVQHHEEHAENHHEKTAYNSEALEDAHHQEKNEEKALHGVEKVEGGKIPLEKVRSKGDAEIMKKETVDHGEHEHNHEQNSGKHHEEHEHHEEHGQPEHNHGEHVEHEHIDPEVNQKVEEHIDKTTSNSQVHEHVVPETIEDLPSKGVTAEDIDPKDTEHIAQATNTNQIPPELPARGLENLKNITPGLPPRRVSSNPFEKYDMEREVKSRSGSPRKHPLIQITASSNKHSVPPSLKDELDNPKFLKNMQTIKTTEERGNVDISDKIDVIRENSQAVSKDFDLIVNRFQMNTKMRDVSDSGIKSDDTLKEDFKRVYNEDISNDNLGEDQKKKLEFWNELISDYDRVVKQYPDKLERAIFTDGIPSDLRPFLWKFITQSNLKNLQNLYANNIKIESPHQAQIEKDIIRTSFIPKDKEESLKNVCIAYSNYDSDLGYTQGLCFIVTPILLTLESEEETFSLLVKLMHDYDLRSFYAQDMPGLMLKLYQFDKLLQETSPKVHTHLGQCGIISNMFVSQWFLSFFGYRFPYEFVIRIFDIILLEGLEALLKFALAAVVKNEDKILSLQFDELLEFLQGDLFNVYLDSEGKYNVTEFVRDAEGIKLMPISLNTITQEFLEISELKKSFNPLDKEISRLKIINKNQCDELLTVKSSFNDLKNDHELIANELIKKRQDILELHEKLDEQHKEVDEWKQKYEELLRTSKLENADSQIPSDLKEGLEQVLESNRNVMERNMDLEHENESLKALVENLEHSLEQQGKTTKEAYKWKLFKK